MPTKPCWVPRFARTQRADVGQAAAPQTGMKLNIVVAPAKRWKIGDLAISEMAGGGLTQRLGHEAAGPRDYGRPRGGHFRRSGEIVLSKPDFRTVS